MVHAGDRLSMVDAGNRLIKVHTGTNDFAKKWTRTKERGTVVVECTQVQPTTVAQTSQNEACFFFSLFFPTVLRFDIDLLVDSIRDS